MKFLVVDDHPIMRFGVRALLAQAWPEAQVVEVDSVARAMAEASAAAPDAIVLDLSLPDASGSEAPARLLRAAPGVPILVLSLNAEPGFAARLMQLGIAGYVPKDRAGEDLVSALRCVLNGERYAVGAVAERLAGLSESAPLAAAPHTLLSAREFRVMQMLGAGRALAEIAQSLGVSVKSVASYRARILAKTGWANNSEIARYCAQHGLADASE